MMDSSKVEDGKTRRASGCEVKEGPGSQLKGFGSFSNKDMFFRADQIDLKSLDIQLEKKLSKIWLKDVVGFRRPKEEWEIDLSKLEIRYVVARGTFGTVYRGTYDGQDIAVKLLDYGEDGHATDVETTALRSSFQQEVAVWHKLEHPNVTKLNSAYFPYPTSFVIVCWGINGNYRPENPL